MNPPELVSFENNTGRLHVRGYARAHCMVYAGDRSGSSGHTGSYSYLQKAYELTLSALILRTASSASYYRSIDSYIWHVTTNLHYMWGFYLEIP